MNKPKTRILIADPDPDVSTTLQLYFESHGHNVRRLDTAAEIKGKARQWQPNAILISTEFTDQSPFKVCKTLLEDTLTGHIPIIMLLHVNKRSARMEALELGVDDVMAKPLDMEELRLRVEAAIRFSTFRMQ